MSHIAIFGGTFNPIHNGHLHLAREALSRFPLDRLLIMPAKIPPHKAAPDLAPDEDRLAMCRLAVQELPGAEVSSYEISRGEVSYTVETLRGLTQERPGDRFSFIMGSDMLLSFQEWREYREILSLAALLAASREIDDFPRLERQAQLLREQGGTVHLFPIQPYPLSSSEIRERIREGKDFSCYLPQTVVQYIKKRNLYRGCELNRDDSGRMQETGPR